MMPITEKPIGLDGYVFADRRAYRRQRAVKGARLSFNYGNCTLVGVVRDRSPKGVRLRFGDICAVPSEFDLEIIGEKETHHGRICWRTLTEIGVALD